MALDKLYPQSIEEVATKYKNASFIMGHAAFQNKEVNTRIAKEYDNIYLETSGFQIDNENVELLKMETRELFDTIPDKIIFGTDWPMFNMVGTQKKWVDYFTNLGVLNEEELQLLFYKNIINIFNKQ